MSEGDLVPDNVSPTELRKEANFRAARAGYSVTADGKLKPLKIITSLPCGPERYNLWPRDKNGNLIQ